MGYSPDAIQHLFDTVDARMPAAQMGGIYANKPGYHNCRANLPSSDYSVQKPPDQKGDGQAGGALDITFGSGQAQYDASRRLLNAKNDSRMHPIREFFGSTDGYNVCGWDFYGGYPVTSDDSHLWHVHISVLREHANNDAALQKVADVITGQGSAGSTTATTSSGGKTLHRQWPSYMPLDEWFGNIDGGPKSHGGYYDQEKPDITAIQKRLIKLGYVPGVTDPNSGWADGIWEKPTTQACSAWQHDRYEDSTEFFGQCWNDDWKRLFTY